MARWGNCDYRQLQKLRENLDRLQSADLENFCRDVSKELAARLLALVIPRTPVGDYSKEVTVTVKRDGKHHKKGDTYTKRVTPSGKKGGTLRRGWTARTEQEAMTAGAGRTMPRPTPKACPSKSRAATTWWGSSTPSTMPAMWNLGTARPAERAGWLDSISSPCLSRT